MEALTRHDGLYLRRAVDAVTTLIQEEAECNHAQLVAAVAPHFPGEPTSVTLREKVQLIAALRSARVLPHQAEKLRTVIDTIMRGDPEGSGEAM